MGRFVMLLQILAVAKESNYGQRADFVYAAIYVIVA